MVAAAVNAPSSGDADVVLTGITHDSRQVRPGDLYAALPGANVHGGTFVASAVERGAAAVLTDRAGADLIEATADGASVPVLVVDSPRAVLGDAASTIYGTGHAPLQTFGITGTNGKTTTAYLLSSALDALGRTTGLIGTVEVRVGDERIPSERTTPEATDLHSVLAIMTERGVENCTMEVSSHALSQHRVDGLVFDVALFTNLSQDHLDYHGSMEEYFGVKAQLFTAAHARRGVVCVDDDWGRQLAQIATIPVTTVASSAERGADWVITAGADREFTLAQAARPDSADPGAILELTSALPGDFNQVNTALATIALLEAGYAMAEVVHAVATAPEVPGRFETVALDRSDLPDLDEVDQEDLDSLPWVVVDYAHTPDAVRAVLAALRPDTTGDLVVVLGAGGDRDRGKRAAMGEAAATGADVVIVADDNPRNEDPAVIRRAILEGASAGPARVLEVPERRSAIATALRLAHEAGPGSTVALVGKGHETGQTVGTTVQHFDDREEGRAALIDLLRSVRASA